MHDVIHSCSKQAFLSLPTADCTSMKLNWYTLPTAVQYPPGPIFPGPLTTMSLPFLVYIFYVGAGGVSSCPVRTGSRLCSLICSTKCRSFRSTRVLGPILENMGKEFPITHHYIGRCNELVDNPHCRLARILHQNVPYTVKMGVAKIDRLPVGVGSYKAIHIFLS
jgi:hypothetical protein